MTTLTRDIERPAFLDAPEAGQLSLTGGSAPARERARGRVGADDRVAARAPLSERLRSEHRHGSAGLGSAAQTGRTVQRRGGEATLDDVLVGAWEGLSAHRPIACPVCSGAMAAARVGGGAACGDCGAQLR